MWPFSRKRSLNNNQPCSEADLHVERMQSIPEDHRNDLRDYCGPGGALLRTVTAGKDEASVLFLVLPKDHFKIQPTATTEVKVRFPSTQTPYDRIVISSCVQVFDSPRPGIDEHFHVRDPHMKRMTDQSYLYLLIADQQYQVYFSRRIPFDKGLKEDMAGIRDALQRHGLQDEHPTVGDDPKALSALKWYQDNVTMQDIMRKYF